MNQLSTFNLLVDVSEDRKGARSANKQDDLKIYLYLWQDLYQPKPIHPVYAMPRNTALLPTIAFYQSINVLRKLYEKTCFNKEIDIVF